MMKQKKDKFWNMSIPNAIARDTNYKWVLKLHDNEATTCQWFKVCYTLSFVSISSLWRAAASQRIFFDFRCHIIPFILRQRGKRGLTFYSSNTKAKAGRTVMQRYCNSANIKRDCHLLNHCEYVIIFSAHTMFQLLHPQYAYAE